MNTSSSLPASVVSKDDCYTPRCLFPITSAIACGKDSLFLGISSVLGNYWTGGLGIYKWTKLPPTLFGGSCEVSEYGTVEDLTPRLDSFSTFEASVAAISVLHRGSGANDEIAVVGLDDGSLQLITRPPCDRGDSKQSLTVDSATYHDWSIERILSQHDCVISLDSGGVVKTWDLERFTPTASWPIDSSAWPRGGQAFEPDASLCSTGGDSSSSCLLASLSPCDPLRQLAVWDVRLSSFRRPPLLCSPKLSSIDQLKDLPRSLIWLSSHLILVGTIQGQLHAYDIRNIISSNSAASMAGQNPGTVASVDTASWFGWDNSHDSKGSNQITQIILSECSPSVRLLGLIGPYGSLSVCELKQNGSPNLLPSRPSYHSGVSITSILSPDKAIGLRRSGGLFLSRFSDSQSTTPEACTHWHAITYSGLPELNVDRNLGPLVHCGLPRVHTGPWGGPWGKHRATCPWAQTNHKTDSYYIRSCSDPVWSTVESSSDADLDLHIDATQVLQIAR
ncbi:hypothetical protein FBUS_00680 [Fasciolopsis buskii]|uniref:Uncharacterized protein n=1 Tax=Fasciolopsis buskii TaxID=27845 RepID=A0A8E0RRH0_9TREM|nr:hypothetical protein FBUS_00680 [Fasciolopsis buski]